MEGLIFNSEQGNYLRRKCTNIKNLEKMQL